MKQPSSYWKKFKEYHKDDMWGNFLKWLEEKNLKKSEDDNQNEG